MFSEGIDRDQLQKKSLKHPKRTNLLKQSVEISLSFKVTTTRSSRWPMFFKIGVLKKIAIFTGKCLCWSLFLIKNFKGTLLKRD